MIEQLRHQGIEITGNCMRDGKTNIIYPAHFAGEAVICKIYCNNYFPQQQSYEFDILKQLKSNGFLVPTIIEEGTVKNKRFTLLSKLKGTPLSSDIPPEYIPSVSQFLENLHNITVSPSYVHPLQTDPDLMVKKAIVKIHDKRLTNESLVGLKISGKVVFCHRDPNFKHILFDGSEFGGVVDFEDAMYLPEEVDYASFLRDQIEYKRPVKEINEFIRNYSGNPNNLVRALARLYILDLGFGHGILMKTKEQYIKDILMLLENVTLEEKILALLRGQDDN